MNDSGWVKLHRQIFDGDLWLLEPFTKAMAWVDLFGNANHEDGIFSVRGNIVKIKRGQLGWSELTMAKRWRWSRDKVRRFLKWLETRQQIEQQKSKLTTIILIVNYEKYQLSSDDIRQQKRQQTIQQKDNRRYINKNDKNDKNINNICQVNEIEEKAKKVIEIYNKIFNKRFKSAVAIESNLEFWLKQYSMEDVECAIKGAKIDDFWNDKITPVILLRRKNPRDEDVDMMAEFINNYQKEYGNDQNDQDDPLVRAMSR